MENQPLRSRRFSSLDIMRGIAIFLMIEAHLVYNHALALDVTSLLAGPFFLAVSGVGFEMLVASRVRRGLSSKVVFLEVVYRALFLFAVTLVMYLAGARFMPGIFHNTGLLNWSIFQVIAFGYIIGFALHLDKRLQVAVIPLIFALGFAIDYFGIQALAIVHSGAFPLVPYITYFIAGQVISGIYQKPMSTRTSDKLITGSAIMLGIGWLSLILLHGDGSVPIAKTLPGYLMITGAFLLVVTLLIRYVDTRYLFTRALSPLEGVGKISLSAYYLHLPIILIASRVAVPSVVEFLVVGPAIILALALLERVWRRYDYALGFEWLLRDLTTAMMNISTKVRRRFASP